MVASVDNALITQFSEMVHHEAQQMDSRLKGYVSEKQMTGDVFAYDGLGPVQAREIQGRNVEATFDDIEHNRRKISRRRFVVNLPVDSSDVRGALLSFDSEYAKTCAAAMKREWDRVAAQAAFANILTGRDFETSVTFANDGGLTVDATAGLTYAKLLEVKQNFMDNDVGTEQDEKLFLTITGDQHTNLMNETELTSGDFVRDYAIEKGQIVRAVGMDIIPFAANVPNPIFAANGSSERELIAASSRGICMGVSKEMSIKITERDDLIETSQVQVIMEVGAVRTEGALVQKVRVTA